MNDELMDAARAAKGHAHAPFSYFPVGCALEAEDGEIVTGCNVESASYGLTMCAERVAIFKGVSEGKTRFVRAAITTDSAALTPPCGACRQLLWEFAPEAEVILFNAKGQSKTYTVRELIPDAFDADSLVS